MLGGKSVVMVLLLTWRLPASGGVVDLVTANVEDGQRVVPAAGRREVFGVRNSGLGRKRIRLNSALAAFGAPSGGYYGSVIMARGTSCCCQG